MAISTTNPFRMPLPPQQSAAQARAAGLSTVVPAAPAMPATLGQVSGNPFRGALPRPQRPVTPTPEEGWLDVGRRLAENTGPAFRQAWGGMAQSLGELGRAGPAGFYRFLTRAPLTGDTGEGLARYGGEVYREAAKELQENAPRIDPESLKGYAYDIANATIQMAPMLGVAIATKDPSAGLLTMVGQVWGQKYGEQRTKGRTPEQAAMDAGFYTLAETIPETIPLGILTRPGGKFLGRTLKAAGAEGLQEIFTEALEAGYDAGVLKDDMTWGEAWQRLQRAGIVGTGAGGVLAAATHPLEREPRAPAPGAPGARPGGPGRRPTGPQPAPAGAPAAPDLAAELERVLPGVGAREYDLGVPEPPAPGEAVPPPLQGEVIPPGQQSVAERQAAAQAQLEASRAGIAQTEQEIAARQERLLARPGEEVARIPAAAPVQNPFRAQLPARGPQPQLTYAPPPQERPPVPAFKPKILRPPPFAIRRPEQAPPPALQSQLAALKPPSPRVGSVEVDQARREIEAVGGTVTSKGRRKAWSAETGQQVETEFFDVRLKQADGLPVRIPNVTFPIQRADLHRLLETTTRTGIPAGIGQIPGTVAPPVPKPKVTPQVAEVPGGGTKYVLPSFVAGPVKRPPKAAKPKAPKREPSDWTEIGRNAAGQTLYQDQRGVRSYIENGVRRTEPVGISPRGEISITRDDDRYKLASEVTPAATDLPEHPGLVIKSLETGRTEVIQPPGTKPPTLPTPPIAPTSSIEETAGGVQRPISPSDARPGTPVAPGAAPQRPTREPPAAEVPGGAPPVPGSDLGRPEAPERLPTAAVGQERGGAGVRGDVGVPPGEGTGPDPRPARSRPDRAVTGENYAIPPGALAASEGRSWLTKAQDNIRAIELTRAIEAEGRPATKEEQEALARYVGWGGIKGAFPDGQGNFGRGFEQIGAALRSLLTDAEYATARRTIQYAHYTSEDITRAMWAMADRLGFKSGQVFEPGMGVGNFAGTMPPDAAASSRYNGLELDPTTAKIARLLYPRWGVRQDDFTKAPLPRDTYDLAIGNPPFADIAITSDPLYAKNKFLLHDYFFAKSLDGVRPGGLLIFISSAGTMNKADTSAREYLAAKADLVGAIRLPNNAFARNAGTEVTTDIIVLRKRLPGEQPTGPAWVNVKPMTLPHKAGGQVELNVNEYFVDHPEMILGEQGAFDELVATTRYGVRPLPGQNLRAHLARAIEQLPENVMSEWQDTTDRANDDFTSKERKEGSFYLDQEGRLMQQRGGVGRPVRQRGAGIEGGKTAAEIERIAALIPIRDSLRSVYAADLAGDTKNAAVARERLNKSYDAFIKKFGPINLTRRQLRRPTIIQQESARQEAREEARYAGAEWREGTFDAEEMLQAGASTSAIARARQQAREDAAARGATFDEGSFDPEDMPDVVIEKRPNIDPFMDDPESYRLRAIEKYDDSTETGIKSEVFERNIITREREPEIKSVGDALLHVLNKHGRLDIEKVAQAAGMSQSEAIEQLGDRIFLNPGTYDEYLTREEYLAGNVHKKLKEAQAAAERNPEFRKNVMALEAVQPAPLPPAEINASLGMPWLPTTVIEQFGLEALGLGSLEVRHIPKMGTWAVNGDGASAAATTTWGTEDRSAPKLIQDALNHQQPRIMVEVERGKFALDPVATEAAQQKLQAIKERFSAWVWEDEKRADVLARFYNENYNNMVVREYDGSYLSTPGVASHWKWRPHQTRVIARIVQDGNTYMAHAVGAGKTSAMIGSGMEMRRLGLVRKPMYVVPNHMLGQFTKEFYEQYPTARIMVADERRFHTDRRKQFVADVANEDLDAIIITHSAFGMIPISTEFQDAIIQEEIQEYRELLEEAREEGDRITRSRVEKQIERLEQRLSGRGKKNVDQVFTFEEMGVDFLFIDEAHLFRKLDFATKMSGVKGVSPQGSQASWDLYVKSLYLNRVRPNRNLVLASGTPVTNTMAELFTVSRYMQPQELAARGLTHFDSWSGAFGDTVSSLEQDPAGGYKPVTRFAKFVNVPELSNMVRQVMDVVTSSQLEQYVTRPKLKGGKRIMNLAEPSPELKRYQRTLAARMQAIAQRRGPPKKGDDILLTVINDGRHAAIDMRLVDPKMGEHGSKLSLLIDNVFRIWKETKRQPFHQPMAEGYSGKPVDKGPATQMVFANLGLSGERGLAVPQFIRQELVRRGVPKDQIALIADYKTSIAKQRLFNDMNEGKIRVLIGSTQKMGVGVNAQRRLYANHNLDPLWFPAEDEQRNGRILRQGNMNPAIEIHDYSTKGTYDSTMWGLMETKARFIEGFFRGDPSIRDMEDLGEASQYEQAKAITTADPRLIELTNLKQQLEKAERTKLAFSREIAATKERLARAGWEIEHHAKRIAAVQQDIAQRQDLSGKKFTATAGGQTYTDRVKFGDALLAQVEALVNKTGDQSATIGEISGFPIAGEAWSSRIGSRNERLHSIRLKRNGSRESDVRGISAAGLVQSIESVLKGFEGEIAYSESETRKAQEQIADYTPKLAQQYTGQPEIDDLSARVAALQAELAADKPAVGAGEAMPEFDEVAELARWEGEGGAPAAQSFPATITHPAEAPGQTELHAGLPVGKIWDWFLGPFFQKFYEPMGRLPAREQYLEGRYSAQGEIDQLGQMTRTLFDTIDRHPEHIKEQIYQYLTTPNAPTSMVDPEGRKDAHDVKKVIDLVGRELVYSGLLEPGQYQKYKDRYLPRIYLKFLLEEGAVQIGAGNRPRVPSSMMGHLRKRKDIPKFDRDILLGEIKDPAYLVSRAFGMAAQSISVLRFLDQVAQHPGNDWVWQDSMVSWRGRKFSARYLLAEAQRLRKNVDAYPARFQQQVRNAADAMERTAQAALSKPPPDPKLYKQVPDTKRYGMLRGLWVKQEIFDDLVNTSIPQYQDETSKWLAQKWRQGISFWKMSKTSLNLPAGHVRNHLSGFFQAQLFGQVPVFRMLDQYAKTIADFAHKGPRYQAMLRRGGRSTSFAASELAKIHDAFALKLKLKHYRYNPLRLTLETAARLMQKAGDAYSFNEQFWKALVMGYHMDRGMPEAQAANIAHAAIFDYSLVPNWLKLIRENAPFGAPFATFMYKALPLSLEAAFKRPWSYWPYAASIVGISALTALYQGLDDDEEKALEVILPDWLHHMQTVILPFKDAYGRFLPIDLSYFFPFGGWLKAAGSMADGDINEALDEIGMGSNPGFQIPKALLTNQDGLGREVWNEGDPPAERALDIFSFLMNQALPPQLSPQGSIAQLYDALTGAPDRWGQPPRSPTAAFARFMGFTTQPMDVEVAYMRGAYRRMAEIRDAEQRAREIARDQSLAPAERQTALERQAAHLRKLATEFAEWQRMAAPALELAK